MKNNSMIFDIFQTLLSEEEVLDVCNCLGYKDSLRKFRVYDLFKFFISSSLNEYKSYRHGAENMERDGLTRVDYSTISKKATNLNYKICKKHFDILISKCNRSLKRILKLPKDLLAIDSTAITAGQGR